MHPHLAKSDVGALRMTFLQAGAVMAPAQSVGECVVEDERDLDTCVVFYLHLGIIFGVKLRRLAEKFLVVYIRTAAPGYQVGAFYGFVHIVMFFYCL